MQPILAAGPAVAAPVAVTGGGGGGRGRRAAAINYAEPGSGDEMIDAGALDSDDSDFLASGGTRGAVRRAGGGNSSAFHGRQGAPQPPPPLRNELDQSYLGMVPPSRFITGKGVAPTRHDYL